MLIIRGIKRRGIRKGQDYKCYKKYLRRLKIDYWRHSGHILPNGNLHIVGNTNSLILYTTMEFMSKAAYTDTPEYKIWRFHEHMYPHAILIVF